LIRSDGQEKHRLEAEQLRKYLVLFRKKLDDVTRQKLLEGRNIDILLLHNLWNVVPSFVVLFPNFFIEFRVTDIGFTYPIELDNLQGNANVRNTVLYSWDVNDLLYKLVIVHVQWVP
jgi:hypothetical protein